MEMSAEQQQQQTSTTTSLHEATPLRALMHNSTTSEKSSRKPTSGEPTGLTPFATRSPLDLNFTNRHIETPVTRSEGNNNNNSTVSSSSSSTNIGMSSSVMRQDVFSDTRPFSSPDHLYSVHKEKENEPSPATTTVTHSSKPLVNLVQPAQPPILTMNGYETSPSIESLQTMSREELTHIRYFTISRSQYGSIEWQSDTDVNGLNLDAIVKIEKNSVEVYIDEHSMKEKPPVGTALNKPAIVTLLNVLPKEGSSVSKVLQYESKLRDTCRKNGAEFIDYNPVTGKWVFKVEHFSKYGLEDDDDDDEPTAVPQPNPLQVPPTKINPSNTATATSTTINANANSTVLNTNTTGNAVLFQAPVFTNTKKLKINSDAFKSSSKLPAATTTRSVSKISEYGATTSLQFDTPYLGSSESFT